MLAILFELNESGIAVIMIEHIMRAVMRFSQRVICLDAGQIIGEGTPAAIVRTPTCRGPTLALRLDVTASKRATARCARCTAYRSRSSEGETVALLGTNGNGKSTLMKCVMGMVRPRAAR